MSRLRQLLGYLGRDGVTELVLGTGRPIAIKTEGVYKPVTSAALTSEQLTELIAGSSLQAQVPTQDSNGTPSLISIDGKPYRVQVARRGDAIIIKIEMTAQVDGAPRESAPALPRTPVVGAASSTAARTAGTASYAVAVRQPTVAPRAGTGANSAVPVAVSTTTHSGAAAIAAAIDFELGERSSDLDFGAVSHATRGSAVPIALASRDDSTSHRSAAAGISPVRSRSPSLSNVQSGAAFHPMVAVSASAEPVFSIDTQPTPPVPKGFIDVVRSARQHNATDLHIVSGRPVMMRVVAELRPLGDPLDAATVQNMLLPLLTPAMQNQLQTRGYADFAVDVPGAGRLRANIGKQREGYKGSFRLVIERVPTLEDLGLPKDLAKVTSYHQGLVVIAGPNGHGKTTTLAALVNLINSSKPHHILTVEDPVEVFHPRLLSLVTQREVGRNTKSFATALKASLREDPDVIVIGELRDRETVEIALTAAETGHLVMATMSTPSAAKTIDRLIDMFPPDDQAQVRASLAGALRFIVAQRLLPNLAGDGVVPAVELLTGVLPVAALIRDNKLFQLPNVQQRGRAFGMIRFDDSILELARSGRISEDVAVRTAEGKKEMLAALNPAAAAAAAAVAAPPVASTGKGLDNIKSKFGGMFGKKDKE
jgi:twitching motility protein PilT